MPHCDRGAQGNNKFKMHYAIVESFKNEWKAVSHWLTGKRQGVWKGKGKKKGKGGSIESRFALFDKPTA